MNRDKRERLGWVMRDGKWQKTVTYRDLGLSKYPYEGYEAKVIPVFERDAGRCQWCDKALVRDTNDWVVHHVDHNNRNNLMENLILLCQHCHRTHHAKQRKAKATE